jgi:hypothetical protein
MGIPNELNRPMTADNHTSICRFQNRDTRYDLVLEVLKDFSEAAVKSQ